MSYVIQVKGVDNIAKFQYWWETGNTKQNKAIHNIYVFMCGVIVCCQKVCHILYCLLECFENFDISVWQGLEPVDGDVGGKKNPYCLK